MPDEALSAEMNHDIHSLEHRRIEHVSIWVPTPLFRIASGVTNKPPNGVASG
jgi:hypothetical protein